jgi:NAD-dependent deacetylase
MTDSSLYQATQTAASLIHKARYAVALTGAGISTPSGIPDFRSASTGLWNRDDPMKVASMTTFRQKPERFYNWLRPLLKKVWDASPNPAHTAVAELERSGCLKAVITQNIDGLHQMAGAKNVLEVHGTLTTMSCLHCGMSFGSREFRQQMLDSAFIPRCHHCESVLKPDIVLFEEMLPEDVWENAEQHCRQADVFLVAGSSLEVIPAAFLPDYALQGGAKLIINNYTPTHLDKNAAVLLPGNVAEVLPEITALVKLEQTGK